MLLRDAGVFFVAFASMFFSTGLNTFAARLTGAPPPIIFERVSANQRLNELRAQGARLLGFLQPSERVQLVILPRLNNAQQLEPLITAQSTPGNPLYHHFLSSTQFKNYFGPDNSMVSQIRSTLTSNGFHIDRISKSSDMIVASAMAPTVENLFNLPLYAVELKDGSHAHVNLASYTLPRSLAGKVAAITGFDSAIRAIPSNGAAATGGPIANTSFYGASPAQLEGANDMPILHGYSGTSSQVLAVLVDGAPIPSDVSTFLNHFGISDTYPLHITRTGNGSVGIDALESTLDVETISAVAPGAYLELYTMYDLTQNSIIQGINSFVNNNGSGQSATLSMSFGGCDSNSGSYDDSIEQLTQSGTTKGQTFVAASGDYGFGRCSKNISGPADVPASAPHVLAVGGTSPDANYGTVWQGGPSGQFGWSESGAGRSSHFPTPPFQAGLTTCTSRCVPDIGLPADLYAGLDIYCSAGCSYNFAPAGGTSLASPLAAAALAEISQMRGSPNGFVTNAVYASYQHGYTLGLVDITAGNNGASAGSGWDFVTGVGTVDWYIFARRTSGI